MNTIEHIIEFNKLYLVWQSPFDQHRTRYVVAEIVRHNSEITLEYLTDSDDYIRAQKLGFDGFSAFRTEKRLHSSGVLDAFMTRLPPRTRGDFDTYLEYLHLPRNSRPSISDFALLGYSAAKLPADTFTIVPSFENLNPPFEFLLEVAGFWHLHKDNNLNIEIGSQASFKKEPTNQFDPNAISIILDGIVIGYVTRALLPVFHQWLNEGWKINAVIERKNGQAENPTLYLFVSVKSD